MTCQDATGQGVGDFVVKFRSEVRDQETGLLFEFLAAQLAIRLGIPMPAPALIELDSSLADATPDADEMFIFDHEVAFAFTRLIGTSSLPFDDAGMSFLRNHPLYARDARPRPGSAASR